MRNVIVFPGGTEIGLEINKSLRYIKDITIFSIGDNLPNPAPFHFKNHFIIPSIYEKDKDWLTELNKIIEDNDIEYVYPAHDGVITEVLKNKKKIKAKIISSPLKTWQIARSKSKTYKVFKDLLPVPQVYENISEITKFPIFLKPDKGSGSVDVYKVDNDEELKIQLNKREKDFIILEYLSGKEYTIDCFTDREKGLLFCGGRERIRIKSGISVNSKLIDNKTFLDYAKIISDKLKFYGAWFFQLKKDNNGILKLLEIGPRIAGTMALNRILGINFPLLSIYEHERINIEILKNTYDAEIYRALDNRFKLNLTYNAVYIDLDDSLILKDKVNIILIRFLYQCVNFNKKIILLTKHRENIIETLNKFKLNENIFNKIIQLKENESKADFIQGKDCIFIDDSFNERKNVANRCKIATFDSSMIKSLLDERS